MVQPGEFIPLVQGILHASGLCPAFLCLEITEGMVVNHLNV
ncbi:hypothetical protein PAAL109150_13815 [Paenibacillus alkaliterrae]